MLDEDAVVEDLIRYGTGTFCIVETCPDTAFVSKLKNRGLPVEGPFAAKICDGEPSLPLPDCSFDTVVVRGSSCDTDRSKIAALLAESCRVSRRFVLLVLPPDFECRVSTERGREWWESCCLEVGLRKHSCYYAWLAYETFNREDSSGIIPMEKMPSKALDRYPLSFFQREIVLHMDMLRFSGRRSDAHCIRYQKAAEFVCEGDRVLDLACGYGYGSRILLENSLASLVVGMDLSPHAIEYASACYGTAGLQFCVGNAQDLSRFPDNSFDFVAGFETIEHLPDPDRYLDEVLRVLTPSGRVMLSAPNRWLNEDGVDPNPDHLHVYTWDGLKRQVAAHGFILEACANELAGGALKCPESDRRWEWVPLDSSEPEKSEWVVVVAMKDPLAGRGLQYVERRWKLPASTDFNVSAFARDYLNPYLVKGMVTIGMRMTEPLQLQKLQKRVIDSYPRDSVDYGAALCGAVYSEALLVNDWIPFPDLCARVEEYCAERHVKPHRLRWQVSCLYALGSLASSRGKLDSAVACWQRCLSYDVSAYSPLLGTKVMDSAFCLARHFASAGEVEKAKQILGESIREAERLLSGSWTNIRGDIDAPMSFGYAESSQLLEKASRASYFLNALTRWPDRPLALKHESLGFTERTMLNLQKIIKDQTCEIFELKGRLKAEKFYSEKANREQTAEIFKLKGRLEAEKFYSEKANREQTAEIFGLRGSLSALQEQMSRVRDKIVEFDQLIGRLAATKAMRLAKLMQAVRNPKSYGFTGVCQVLCHAVRAIVKKTPFASQYGLVAISREFWRPVVIDCGRCVAGDVQSGKVDIVLQADNFMVGGLENVMIDQACYFMSAGRQVVILVLGHPGESVKVAEARGVPVVVLPDIDQSYRAFMAKTMPDVVFANCSYNGAEICKSMGIPFVQVVHNTYVWTRTIPESKRVILDSLPFTTACVCVSRQVADFFISEYHADPSSTFVIPNGILLEKFVFSQTAREEIRSRYGMKDDDTLFIAAASIGDQKNYPALLRAMVMALKECPTAKLLIVGHVYHEGIFDLMKKIIADAHAEEHIIYIGCVPDIERYFSAADLLVHCSFYEGGPLTVIEGLATTLPFLATRTGCLSTLPDEFSGCTIIPPQIPIEELTSSRLWERSAEFDAGLARRIVDYCKAGHHDRVVVSASLRKRFAREYAFESYLTLTRILASGRPVASFPEEQNQTWVDYVEKNESL